MRYNELKIESIQIFEREKNTLYKIVREDLGLKSSDVNIENTLVYLYLPLYLWSKRLHQEKQSTVFVGITGVNGVGKTTLTEFVRLMLLRENFNVLAFSMDDLYPTKEQRFKWAKEIDPELKTRLIYDNTVVKEVFKNLIVWKGPISIPQFDKGIDDRKNEEDWLKVNIKPDIVVFEGVFVAAKALKDTKNLSKKDRFINEKVLELEKCYNAVDLKVVMLAKHIEDVVLFRQQQEFELQKKRGKEIGMTPHKIKAFVNYFQIYLKRYTYPLAVDRGIDITFMLDSERNIVSVIDPKIENIE